MPGAGFAEPPQPDSSDAVTRTKPAATDRSEKLILLRLPVKSQLDHIRIANSTTAPKNGSCTTQNAGNGAYSLNLHVFSDRWDVIARTFLWRHGADEMLGDI